MSKQTKPQRQTSISLATLSTLQKALIYIGFVLLLTYMSRVNASEPAEDECRASTMDYYCN